MMECNVIGRMLPGYLEKVLTPQEETLIEQHLSSCRKCARALLDLKRTGEMMKDLDKVDPPPLMTQQIMSRIRGEEGKKSIVQKLFFPVHVKIPLQVFAVLVVAVIAIYVLKAVEPQMKAGRSPSVLKEASELAGKPEAEEKGGEGRKPEPPIERDVLHRNKAEERSRAEKAKEVLQEPGAVRSEPAEPLQQRPLAKKMENRRTGREGPAKTQQGLVAGQAKQKDKAAGVTRERKILSDAKERIGTRTDQIRFILHVEEASTSVREVEALLSRLGALKIHKESFPDAEVLTAELGTGKVQELVENLMLIGEVGASHPFSNVREEGVPIRIQIVKKNGDRRAMPQPGAENR